MKNKYSLLLLLLSVLTITKFTSPTPPPWDWDKTEQEQLYFPKDFLFGFANAEYQVSGSENCPNICWNEYEQKHKLCSGKSCDFWNNYKKEIDLAYRMGSNSFRFSIDWGNIEPEEGQFNESAIQHYHDLINYLNRKKMTPMLTIHHFVDPTWFGKKGGFEKEENIKYFLRFSERMFKEYGEKVPLWITFNEPTIYAFMGYVLGLYPPEKHNPHLASTVLCNLLKAHVEAYKMIKTMPNGQDVKVGIVHQMLKFESYRNWNLLDKTLAAVFTHFTHSTAFNFLKTGVFHSRFPGIINVHYEDSEAPKCMDFIGLNYYSRVLIDFCQPSGKPGDIMTDYYYPIYPEGIYNAIKECAEFNVPIYITENGAADAKDDRREIFIKRYIYAVSQAVQDGYDVRGYYYWTLTDNFEWNEGWKIKFGLFEFDPVTQERTLKPGGRILGLIYNSFTNNFKIA